MSDADFLAALPGTAFAFMLVLCRVGGCVMLLPGLGEIEAPVMARLGLAVGISILIYPHATAMPAAMDATLASQAGAIVAETVTGVALGTLARLPVLALSMAGGLIATLLGLSSVMQPDPALGGQSTALARIFSLGAPVLILTSGLYALPLAALSGSYDLVATGSLFTSADLAQSMAQTLGTAFALALQLSAPFIIASIVWQVAVGLLARMAPQLQAFAVTVPGQILGGLLLVGLLAPQIVGVWQSGVSASWSALPGQ